MSPAAVISCLSEKKGKFKKEKKTLLDLEETFPRQEICIFSRESRVDFEDLFLYQVHFRHDKNVLLGMIFLH